MKSHCTPSMLKSELMKLIFFLKERGKAFFYIGATDFRSHTSSAIFVPVLCLFITARNEITSSPNFKSFKLLFCSVFQYFIQVLNRLRISESNETITIRGVKFH